MNFHLNEYSRILNTYSFNHYRFYVKNVQKLFMKRDSWKKNDFLEAEIVKWQIFEVITSILSKSNLKKWVIKLKEALHENYWYYWLRWINNGWIL